MGRRRLDSASRLATPVEVNPFPTGVTSLYRSLTPKKANEKRTLVIWPGLYKGMSRTFFSLRRMRRFISRHPAPLTREDARLVSCPGLLHLSSGIFLSSDDADRFRNLSSRALYGVNHGSI